MTKTTFKNTAFLFAAAFGLAARSEVPDELIRTDLAEIFGIAPTIGEPKLSPDGSQLIFLQQTSTGVTVLQNMSLADGSVTTLLAGSEDGYDIMWCDFASETRILCDLQKSSLGFDPERQMFYVLESDGSDLEELRQGTGCATRDPLRNTYPVNWLPEEEDHIVFFCGGNTSRLNINSRRITNEVGAGESGSAKRLYSNDHGVGNIYRGRIGNNDYWWYRPDVGVDWTEFASTSPLDFDAPFRPVGYGPTTDRVFNIAWNEATGTWALFSRQLGEDFENSLSVTHPLLDVQLVDTVGRYERVVSVPYIDGRTRRHIVDDRVREVHAFLSGLLPDVNIEILDEDWEGQVYLARASTEITVGDFIVVNMEDETVRAIGPEYAHLAPFALAETALVEIPAEDGGTITGQLTYPIDTAGPAPTVIIPRSAPSHDDVADPNYLVQFLAASGYAVLRVNNRSSLDLGGGWLPERSVVGWKQSADDINTAISYLTEEGIAQPGAVCGIGKNYGGYAALTTALRYPELLQCIVSISGIADPRGSAGSQMVGQSSVLSSDVLDEASPVKRAKDIQPPVLLFHTQNDTTARMAQHAVQLSNAMESAGGRVQFIQYVYDNQDIHRGPYRTDMLARIADFLAEHIGVAPLADVELVSGTE